MRKIHCLNPISKLGTGLLTENYEMTDNLAEAEGILVRSASLHEMQFSNSLLAIARAGAGVNNIPLYACAQEGIVVFNTPERASTTFRLTSVRRLVLSYSIHRAPMQTVSKSWCWLACCWEPET